MQTVKNLFPQFASSSADCELLSPLTISVGFVATVKNLHDQLKVVFHKTVTANYCEMLQNLFHQFKECMLRKTLIHIYSFKINCDEFKCLHYLFLLTNLKLGQFLMLYRKITFTSMCPTTQV